jgi:hypothetical protein
MVEHKLLTRAEWYLELLTQWEMLQERCEQPPMTGGKKLMHKQLEYAIGWLKKTYDVEDLMDISNIEQDIDGKDGAEGIQE